MTIARIITDINRIKEFNNQLGATLKTSFRFSETREITYPSAHHTGTVYFQERSGTQVHAWSPHIDNHKLVNYLLIGEPNSPDWLEISVQINFPADSYNRRMAGVFIEDENGDILVAHRGKLTRHNAGLPRQDVLREFGSVIDVEDTPGLVKVIPISSLDDPELASHLFDFAFRARQIATKLGDGLDSHLAEDFPKSATPKLLTEKRNIKKRILKLRNYYDEYAGRGHRKAHGGGKRTVEHGYIVKALEAHLVESRLESGLISQKAQAIDLAIVSSSKVDLYEVKTSARTTDVYTGVGQLLIHGECISELLSTPVKRHLVLPREPEECHKRHIISKGETQILTFEKNNGEYIFRGIEL